MRAAGTGVSWCVFGTMLALALPVGSHVAQARTVRHAEYRDHGSMHFVHYVSPARRHFAWRGAVQCVTFARSATGVELTGNAVNWWGEAKDSYARGNVPEPNAILSFRASGRMRLGHVAVVSEIINSREIDVDHAHWAGGGISRRVSVIDVSPSNDWTAVRVSIGHGGTYGSIYPTNGFIYDRAPGTTAPTAKVLPVAAPLPDINPPPHDWRAPAELRGRPGPKPTDEEVAEMPAGGRLDVNLRVFGLNLDAPIRSLR
jgi:surface antigen